MNPFDYITLIPNAIPKDTINLILSHTNTNVSPALVGISDSQAPNLDYRVTNWIALPIDIVQNVMSSLTELYNTQLLKKYKQPIKNIEPTQCLEYVPGGHYKAHNDSETYVNNKLQRVCNRDISILCYLNDDYTGGEIEFIQYGITIKPKAGTILAFPSYFEYEHQVHPVITGKRYSIVTWIETENRIYNRPYEN